MPPLKFSLNLFRVEDECISILAVKHALERDFRHMETIRQQAGGDAGAA